MSLIVFEFGYGKYGVALGVFEVEEFDNDWGFSGASESGSEC